MMKFAAAFFCLFNICFADIKPNYKRVKSIRSETNIRFAHHLKGSVFLKPVFTILFGLLFTVSFSCQANPESADTRLHAYRHLLLQNDFGQIRLAARSLLQDGLFDRDSLDLAATVLLRESENGQNEANIDTLSWLAKYLGESTDSRYRAVLDEVIANADSRKLLGHVEKSRDKLKASTNPPYAVAADFLAKLKAETDAYVMDKHSKALNASELKLNEGDTLAAVLEANGFPDVINDLEFVNKGPFVGIPGAAIHVQGMDLYYFGKKVVRMNYSKVAKTWQVKHVFDLLSSEEQYTKGENAVYYQNLMINGAKALRMFAIALARSGRYPQDILDVAAQRIALSIKATDEVEVDGLSHLCNAIKLSGSSRYREFFSTLLEQAIDKKMRDYLESVIANSKNAATEQFSFQAR